MAENPCVYVTAVSGRVVDPDGRPVIAELYYGSRVQGQHFSLSDGAYLHGLVMFPQSGPPPAALWVEVRPLYPGVADTAWLPVPSVRWRERCPPAAFVPETTRAEFRLVAPGARPANGT